MWYLEKLSARGGLLGSTQVNQFEGHTFQTEEDLFVRETTQNAIDNPSGTDKPRIVFRMVTLTGTAKRDFLKMTDLKELYENKELLKKANDDNELHAISGSKPLSLLYIEDFNTTGLDGVIADPKSNWMRFNMHGDAQKLAEELKIGSYGYGKSVLSRASGTRSFIVHTVVRPNAKDGHRFRLMGHTFQDFFADGARHKSGRGWFCRGKDSEDDPIPFVDNDAQSLASQLGFTTRGPSDTGTSFLLIGTCPAKRPLSIARIRHAFETWWWPSLVDDRIDVEFWEDGVQQSGPAPRLRSDLKLYIDCKTKLDGGVSTDVHTTQFSKVHDRNLGQVALTLAADHSIFDSPLHPKSPGPRRVARMRARSGMITEYGEFGTEKRVPFVGFYCAHEDIDQALKLSEPAAHDDWSKVSQRLTRTPYGAELVEAVEDKTQTACYNFQRKYSAARAPLSERLPELERMLGAAFESQGKGTPRPGPGPGKSEQFTEVDFPGSAQQAPNVVYGKRTNKIDGVIRYALRSGYRKKRRVGVWLSLNVAEDAQHAKGEPLTISVSNTKTGKLLYQGDNPRFVLEMLPGQSVSLRVQSVDYPRHQLVLFDHGEYRP